MRVSITLKSEKMNFGILGKLTITPHIINVKFWNGIKRVGWKRLWKIRKIKTLKPLKQKWTIEAYESIQVIHGVDIHQALSDALQQEHNRATISNG